jgi:hypothetical protein
VSPSCLTRGPNSHLSVEEGEQSQYFSTNRFFSISVISVSGLLEYESSGGLRSSVSLCMAELTPLSAIGQFLVRQFLESACRSLFEVFFNVCGGSMIAATPAFD